MTTRIIDLSKKEMYSLFNHYYFGYTINYKNGDSIIWLCNDLPTRVYESVKVHELQHVKDRAFLDGDIWRWEFNAWKAQFKTDFIGTLQTIWLSITDTDRIKLYIKRIFA